MSALGRNVARCRDISLGEIDTDRDSSASDCLSEEEDVESGGLKQLSGKNSKAERDCRICHLGFGTDNAGDGDDEEFYGLPIQLGCSCKGDLGVAHRKCADTWFKIKGNMTCEICGTTALNVAGEQTSSVNTAASTQSATAAAPMIHVETRNFWHGRRVMNFLLAGMVFAFIISWLFHFKVLK